MARDPERLLDGKDVLRGHLLPPPHGLANDAARRRDPGRRAALAPNKFEHWVSPLLGVLLRSITHDRGVPRSIFVRMAVSVDPRDKRGQAAAWGLRMRTDAYGRLAQNYF
jgi:hypothetical protein